MGEKKTIAIVGASYLQLPLVKKAKAMGLRTICFAWPEGAVCREEADAFYPISIIEKERILGICQKEGVDGIVSIASDVAVPTIAYVATRMKLVGNSEESAVKSTNKYLMRQALSKHGVSCPKFVAAKSENDIAAICSILRFPLVVKPTDRSGSMGVSKVVDEIGLRRALTVAIADSFCGKAVVEECVENMHEVSVEGISWQGEYHLLQITDKVTTGAPHYVELGHHQPAMLSDSVRDEIVKQTTLGIKALDIKNGASHAELMISGDGKVYVTEIGARMGGDFIGSDLVKLSTGYDFLEGVINVALGNFSWSWRGGARNYAGVWFYTQRTLWAKDVIAGSATDARIVSAELQTERVGELTRSADRSGYFIYCSDKGRYEQPKGN